MLSIIIKLFDKLFEEFFLDATLNKIKDCIDQRNVKRTIQKCADAPAQALESYFRNEGLSQNKVEIILYELQQAINSIKIDAKILTSASLDAAKLTEIILAKHTISEVIKEEQLEWPFHMALQISADSLCNIGPRLAEWEKEAWRKSFEAFDKLMQNQESILKLVGPGGEGSLDDRFEHTYRSHILRRLSQIDASTLRVSSSLFLDLKSVFVEPDVIKLLKSVKSSRGKKGDKEKMASLEEARKQVFTEQEPKEQNRVKAETIIPKNKRCAIVGLPGSGKTTLLQHILLLTASGDMSFEESKGVVPVIIRVRQLDSTNLPGVEDLLQIAEGKLFAGARPGFLGRKLEDGRVLILIDGLDEIIPEKRNSLTNWIFDLIELYPNTRYIISSRPAGYQSDLFKKFGFSEFMLCDFNVGQIHDYVRRWIKAVQLAEGASPEEADAESTRYATALVERAAKNAYVRRIATNPLLLSTLCLVQKYEGGDLPNRRVVLYQRCIEGLLFHWDNKRGLPPAIVGSLPLERKIMLLRRLALEMQVRGVAEIEEIVVENSFRCSLDIVGEKACVELILTNIKDRSGLLVERRPKIYGFSHLTFQEYLAALSINQGDFKTYDRLFLFSKRLDPQWNEVIALYAGIAPKDSVECLISELLDTNKPDSILICGECLAAARDVELKVQKNVINSLLVLPAFHDKSSKPLLFEVNEILNSLDDSIVLEQVMANLSNLKGFHTINYLFSKKDPRTINALMEAGIRILTGVQKTSEYDYCISLILLIIEHNDSINALIKLVDVAYKETNLGDRVAVLFGILHPSVWNDEKKVLSGVLNYFNKPDAIEEQKSICTFIINSISKLSELNLNDDIINFLTPFRFKYLGNSPLIKKLDQLSQYGDSSLREIASTALNCFNKVLEIYINHEKQNRVIKR